MFRVVLDTSVLITARRSPTDASNALLRRVGQQRLLAVASVPMFLEYEAVMKRRDQLEAMGVGEAQVDRFLDALAGLIEPVTPHYLWRPSLADPADEMFLEAAVVGRAGAIVTFNARDFVPATRFGVEVLTPAAMLRRLP